MRNFKIVVAAMLFLAFSGCEDLLEVPDISEKTVLLLAPSDDTVVVQNSVVFSWDEVNEATGYHVQVSTPNFENAEQIVLDSIIKVDSTFMGTRISKTLLDGTYQWRVKAINSAFDSEFSTNSFAVDTAN